MIIKYSTEQRAQYGEKSSSRRTHISSKKCVSNQNTQSKQQNNL